MTETLQHGSNRCDYAIRMAGHDMQGRRIAVHYSGDHTTTCQRWGSPYVQTFYSRKPGTPTVRVPFEGIVIRCPQHALIDDATTRGND